jgi:hypothetical protein
MMNVFRSCASIFSVRTENTINNISNVPDSVEPAPINNLVELYEINPITNEHVVEPIVEPIIQPIIVPIENDKSSSSESKLDEQETFDLLNSESKRKLTPTNAKITLLTHQEAMFERCTYIESNNCKAEMIVKNEDRYMISPSTGKRIALPEIGPVSIGILNDKPGAGKTYVLLSLLQNDPGSNNQSNIVCVPQNIFAQWKNSFESYFPTESTNPFEIFYIDSYANVLELYELYDTKRPRIQTKPRLFLVNDGFIESVSQTIIDIDMKIHRYIIDEIDSIQHRLYTPFYADFVWLVSASFIFKGKNLVGPFKFNPSDIKDIVCKCDEDFVHSHIKLPEPITEQILCEDNEIQMIKNYVSSDILQGLNTYDYRPFIKFLRKSFHPNKHTLFELCEMYVESLKITQEEINAIQQEIDKIEYETKETIVESNEYLDKLRFSVIEKTFQLNNYNDLLKLFESLKQSTLEETKDYKFKVDLFGRIQSDPTKKWIIFNDNSASLNEQSDYLQAFKIKCVMLDGGNSKKVEKAIQEFKKGDVQVLLLNSVLEGAGMNLENADYVVFMHRTRPRLVNQVLGRAQRYGRNTPLHIIELFNKNETDLLFENEDLIEIQANQYVIDHKF